MVGATPARRTAGAAQLATFVVLAIALSWAWWLPMLATGAVVRNGIGWPTHLPGLLGPAVAAVVTVALFRRGTALAELGARCLRWRLPWHSWLILAATAALAAIPLAANPDASASAYLTFSGAPELGVGVVLYVLVVNGFGEELGWRGFLADALLRRMRPAVVALVVWVLWGIWHLPLFGIVGNFRELGAAGVAGWALGLLSGSVLLTWLYARSRRSILLVALWHTAFNFATATEASAGVGAAVASMLVVAASVVVLCLPWSWRRPHAGGAADPDARRGTGRHV